MKRGITQGGMKPADTEHPFRHTTFRRKNLRPRSVLYLIGSNRGTYRLEVLKMMIDDIHDGRGYVAAQLRAIRRRT